MRAWEVLKDGAVIGLFYGDYFARAGKAGGAWMSSFRDQERVNGDVLPIIINNCNFGKSDPCLLSFDDCVTLFHEFGHALHGLLSQVRFPRLSGTNVARDFVELPSQLYEHWLEEPEVLTRFARHFDTGEPMPKPLLDKLLKARNYGQGFATVEFLASALIDMDFHSRDVADPMETQAATLNRIGISQLVVGEGFTPGDHPHVMAAPGVPSFTPLICYEVIFPHNVIDRLGPRPGWLVNITDDSWFGPWAGPRQHLLTARVRAIEEGLPIARAANTGISAMIDPVGRVRRLLPLDQAGVVDAGLPAALSPPPYARFGDLVFFLFLVIAAFAAFVLAPRSQSASAT
jgi:hypothetical protein